MKEIKKVAVVSKKMRAEEKRKILQKKILEQKNFGLVTTKNHLFFLVDSVFSIIYKSFLRFKGKIIPSYVPNIT